MYITLPPLIPSSPVLKSPFESSFFPYKSVIPSHNLLVCIHTQNVKYYHQTQLRDWDFFVFRHIFVGKEKFYYLANARRLVLTSSHTTL